MEIRTFKAMVGIFCLVSIVSLIIPQTGYCLTYENHFIILGKSRIIIPDKNWVVGAQVDRVFRDIHWDNPVFGKHADPFRLVRTSRDLVPYMEGRLIGELMTYAHTQVVALAPVKAIRHEDDNFYYANDGNGNYVFKIDPSKTEYETAQFSKDRRRGLFVDTHGFNMIAGPAIRLSKTTKINLAVACMDLPAKAQAALMLAREGINTYGPCDRFLCDIIGYKKDSNIKAEILGTAPIRKTKVGAIIGGQDIKIDLDEPVIVQTTDRPYPDQYCDTPNRYFQALVNVYNLNMNIIPIYANVGESDKLIRAARMIKASVIGVRVYNRKDAEPVRAWLKADRNNRAILFHSAPYTYGYELFFEFPDQTAFGDPNPVFE